MVQLTGIGRDGEVCEFAFTSDIEATDRPHLTRVAELLKNPWSLASGFSTRFKVDALFPGNNLLSSSTRRLGDVMTFALSLPPGYFKTYSAEALQQAMDELSQMLVNNVRIEYGPIRPSALHIVLVGWQDKPGELTCVADNLLDDRRGAAPQHLWLADRHVDVPA